MRFDSLLPLVAALSLSAPMFVYVGHQAGWVLDAWQVSAVLLGFVIALLIFLLQAVADRSLRAERTLRAVITGSRVAWPTWFTLVFIGWVAVIDRFSATTSSPAPTWVTTWSMGFFLAQLLALIAMLGGVRRLLAPAGIARVLERAIGPEVELGVEQRLVTQTAEALLVEKFRTANIAITPSFDSYPVIVAKSGEIDDINLRLPRRLAKKKLGDSFNSLAATIGNQVNPDTPIVEVSSAPTAKAERLYRSAFRVRRRHRRRADWLPLFEDVSDMARRALVEGTTRDLDLATRVLLQALITVPKAYRRFGVEYDYSAVRPLTWEPADEDGALERLRSITTDIAVSDRPDALVHWVAFPYDLAVAALRDDVLLMFDQALNLWLTQVDAARRVSVEGTRNAVIERVHRLSSALSREFLADFESDRRSLAERQLAMTRFQRVIWFRGQLMKRYVDAEDVDAFLALFSELRPIHLQPDHEVLRLRREAQLVTTADDRARIAREIRLAEQLEAAVDAAFDAFSWTQFRAGAWAAWKFREGILDERAWKAFALQLANPFFRDSIADHLDDVGFARDEISPLGRWRLDLPGIYPSTWVGEPPEIAMALFWTALLLLRITAEGHIPQLSSKTGFSYSQQFENQLSYIESDAARWEDFVGGDVRAKADLIRSELKAARERQAREWEERIAAAPIARERVDGCEERARRAFERGNELRAALLQAGHLTVEADSDATSTLLPRVVPREEFIADGRVDAGPQGDQVGRGVAEWQEEWMYRQLVELGLALGAVTDGGGDLGAAAIAAIADLTATGAQPDNVLVPWGHMPHELFGSQFTWDPASPGAMGHVGIATARLVRAMEGHYAVVCDLSRTLLVREKEVGEETNVPLSIHVQDITPQRASELLDRGLARASADETREQAIQALCRVRVELETEFACEVVGVQVNPALRLIQLPTKSEAPEVADENGHEHSSTPPTGTALTTLRPIPAIPGKLMAGVRSWGAKAAAWWRTHS